MDSVWGMREWLLPLAERIGRMRRRFGRVSAEDVVHAVLARAVEKGWGAEDVRRRAWRLLDIETDRLLGWPRSRFYQGVAAQLTASQCEADDGFGPLHTSGRCDPPPLAESFADPQVAAVAEAVLEGLTWAEMLKRFGHSRTRGLPALLPRVYATAAELAGCDVPAQRRAKPYSPRRPRQEAAK